jgi:hypothetical protein
VAGHLLGDLQLAAVLQLGGDAGGPEAVASDARLNAGGEGATLNHHVHVGLGQRQPGGELAVPEGRE